MYSVSVMKLLSLYSCRILMSSLWIVSDVSLGRDVDKLIFLYEGTTYCDVFCFVSYNQGYSIVSSENYVVLGFS